MIVHIGFHKTGTTFLQNNVFTKIEGIKYYSHMHCATFFKDIMMKSNFEFRLSENKYNLIEKELYSFESLVGIFGLGYNAYEIARNLKDIGFKKIIISIRNQKSCFESIYRQYIQQGGVMKPKDFFDEKNKFFRWDYLNYHCLISYYIELFGVENIFIILQENLLKKTSLVVENLSTFVGHDILYIDQAKSSKSNKSLSSLSIKILRFINHFTYNEYRPSNILCNRITTWKFQYILQKWIDPFFLSKISKNKKMVSSDIIKRVDNYYQKDNKKLSSFFDLELDKMDYFSK